MFVSNMLVVTKLANCPPTVVHGGGWVVGGWVAVHERENDICNELRVCHGVNHMSHDQDWKHQV